jgi:hypothetical protein
MATSVKIYTFAALCFVVAAVSVVMVLVDLLGRGRVGASPLMVLGAMLLVGGESFRQARRTRRSQQK